MKLFIIIIMIFVLIYNSECKVIRVRRGIIDTIVNRTVQIKEYVREKGRSLKNFYDVQVKSRIPYFGRSDNITMYMYLEDKLLSLRNKFQGHVRTAENTASTIYDSIAPVNDNECSDDDTINSMSTPEIIAMHRYLAESHTVITKDGYLLTIHRIPFSKYAPKKASFQKTVLIHHGLLASSADWVIPGPRNGLAYILADAGYDVWMANARGNMYSRAHVSKHDNTQGFWNFTFHEISQYDLPAIIDYIVEKKGSDVELNYIGYSMGTTALFALLSTKTEYNNILRAGFAMAPVAYMTQVKSPITILAKFGNNIGKMMKLLGANEFLPRNAVLRYLSKHSCKIADFDEALCEISMFVLCGHGKEQFDRSLMPLILGHVPAGASTKTLVHYAQEIRNKGRFEQFDYGEEENLIVYGSATPPEYEVNKISLPIALFSAQDDWISSVFDATKLYQQLLNPIDHYIVPLKEFNHLDFLFARDAPSLVYAKLLELLENNYQRHDKTINEK